MLKYITGDCGVDITTADYATYAVSYLKSIGMAEEDVKALKAAFVKAA